MSVASQKNEPEPDTKEEKERKRDLSSRGKAEERFWEGNEMYASTHAKTKAPRRAVPLSLPADSPSF
jgi:hypothetical protein